METSLVVPVYNEEKRIEPFMKDLESTMRKLGDHEVIFVDDGSQDRTNEILEKFSRDHNNVRIISYKKNMGKGYAVKTGIMAANGRKIIFIDADGSTSPAEISGMLPLLDQFDVVVGDRTHFESKVDQPTLRRTTGKLFNLWANIFFGINVRDTLCGFKGFRSEIGKSLFSDVISNRWIFDVEIFYKIRKRNYSMHQMSIKWEHKDGTKIKLFDPLKMFFQLAALRMKVSGRK